MSEKLVRMLLVEDDRVDQMAFKRLVQEERLPYDYVIAGSVEEARKTLRSERFDMIVADFVLGDGTSFDILEDCRDTPFIVATGTGSEETAVEMMKRGARDYLIKDPDGKYLKVLSVTVKNVLAHEAAQRELRKYREHLEDLVRERTAELEAEIQEHLRTEREKQVLQQQLHQAQKMEAVGQLAAGVAHDFNNMLMVVSINAERIRSDYSDPALLESAEMILAAANQASGVTRSLLTFSREIPVQKQRTNLRDVVRKSAMLLTKLLPTTIDLQIINEQDCWIRGDPVQVQQVILNLAINARDAMHEGGRLRIEISPASGADSQASSKPVPVRLVIDDTGTGMTAEVKERIFDPFFTTKPRGQGTGLGLAIVHGVLKNHDASIEVESECGKGTRFTITFPGATPEIESEGADCPGPVPAGAGECVLIAEDNAYLRSLIVSSLVQKGYHVIEAQDGAELLEQFQQHAADGALVILDLEMPRIGGLQCLKTIRHERPSLPVIVITGSPEAEARLSLDQWTRLLRKPFSLATLAAAVSRMLTVTIPTD